MDLKTLIGLLSIISGFSAGSAEGYRHGGAISAFVGAILGFAIGLGGALGFQTLQSKLLRPPNFGLVHFLLLMAVSFITLGLSGLASAIAAREVSFLIQLITA